MTPFTQELTHPTQPGRVRLRVYEPDTGGFLATEERLGTAAVISTLGLFDTKEAALARVEERARALGRQRYRPVSAA